MAPSLDAEVGDLAAPGGHVLDLVRVVLETCVMQARLPYGVPSATLHLEQALACLEGGHANTVSVGEVRCPRPFFINTHIPDTKMDGGKRCKGTAPIGRFPIPLLLS